MSKKIISTLAVTAFLLMLLTISCSDNSTKKAGNDQLSFCYWNTSFSLDTALWRQTGAGHLYLRYFDVDWDNSSGDAAEGHIENIIFPSAYDCGSCNSVVKLINDFYQDLSDESNNDSDIQNSYKTEIYIWNPKKQTLQKQIEEK